MCTHVRRHVPTHTRTHTHFMKMFSQSLLCTGLSHNWNRVWNFCSNIHECRPALHHLCTSPLAAMQKNKARAKETWRMVSGLKQIILELERERTIEKAEEVVDEATCVFLFRLLSLSASQTWLHHSFLVCRSGLTHADRAYAIQH